MRSSTNRLIVLTSFAELMPEGAASLRVQAALHDAKIIIVTADIVWTHLQATGAAAHIENLFTNANIRQSAIEDVHKLAQYVLSEATATNDLIIATIANGRTGVLAARVVLMSMLPFMPCFEEVMEEAGMLSEDETKKVITLKTFERQLQGMIPPEVDTSQFKGDGNILREISRRILGYSKATPSVMGGQVWSVPAITAPNDRMRVGPFCVGFTLKLWQPSTLINAPIPDIHGTNIMTPCLIHCPWKWTSEHRKLTNLVFGTSKEWYDDFGRKHPSIADPWKIADKMTVPDIVKAD